MAQADLGEHDAAKDRLLSALAMASTAEYRIVRCFALVALGDLAASRDEWNDARELMVEYFEIDGTVTTG